MSLTNEQIYQTTLGYFLAPITALMEDESVREIMINGASDVWVEQGGGLKRSEVIFEDEAQLHAAVTNLAQYVGLRLEADTARFDARLPQGHRVHVVLPPVSRVGISITIRKHSKSSLALADLVASGSLSTEAEELLRGATHLEKNMIISGGTGTGKTTFINALSELIPDHNRIVTIEDAAELQLSQEHVVSLETRPPNRNGEGAITIRDLLHSSLRMRPDRIIVGECRGGEALDLLQAMNTGHGGSMSTVHANTPLESLRRLETLALFSGEEIPLRFLRAQVAAAVHVVIQLQRVGGRRSVASIAEVLPLTDDGEYEVNELFTYDFHAEKLIRVSEPTFADRL